MAIGLVGTSSGDAGSGRQHPPPPAAGGGATTGAVTIKGFAFAPPDLEVAPGTKVTWTNQDSATHTVKDSSGLFDKSADLARGDSFSHVYEKAGTFASS